MKATKYDFRKVAGQIKAAWRHRWVRVVTSVVVVAAAYGGGHDAGLQEGNNPREHSSPGGVVTEVELHGKWDGVGTLPDGTPFCMVGWPCEDLPEK